jgi:hypothetical protein
MPSWTSTEVTNKWPRKWSMTSAVILGAVYGIALRYFFGGTIHPGWVMTIAFLFFGAGAVGFITIQQAERVAPRSIGEWIGAPGLPILIACGLAVLFHLEGYICLIFALPIALIAASVGGVAAGLLSRFTRRGRISTLTCVALLPFLIAPLETHLTPPTKMHTVASEIRVHATPETVWQNIERVPAIAPSELRTTWTQRIGFPRPIEATLSYEGVGGVRHASFERGLMFIETVTAWEPEHRLAFGIRADSAHIPAATLDEHVTIGGRYFDVLDGEYRLEPLANGDTLLHLTSHQRLSTDFNAYAGLWSDAVMQSLQTSILEVIQHRCEQQTSSKLLH